MRVICNLLLTFKALRRFIKIIFNVCTWVRYVCTRKMMNCIALVREYFQISYQSSSQMSNNKSFSHTALIPYIQSIIEYIKLVLGSRFPTTLNRQKMYCRWMDIARANLKDSGYVFSELISTTTLSLC